MNTEEMLKEENPELDRALTTLETPPPVDRQEEEGQPKDNLAESSDELFKIVEITDEMKQTEISHLDQQIARNESLPKPRNVQDPRSNTQEIEKNIAAIRDVSSHMAESTSQKIRVFLDGSFDMASATSILSDIADTRNSLYESDAKIATMRRYVGDVLMASEANLCKRYKVNNIEELRGLAQTKSREAWALRDSIRTKYQHSLIARFKRAFGAKADFEIQAKEQATALENEKEQIENEIKSAGLVYEGKLNDSANQNDSKIRYEFEELVKRVMSKIKNEANHLLESDSRVADFVKAVDEGLGMFDTQESKTAPIELYQQIFREYTKQHLAEQISFDRIGVEFQNKLIDNIVNALLIQHSNLEINEFAQQDLQAREELESVTQEIRDRFDVDISLSISAVLRNLGAEQNQSVARLTWLFTNAQKLKDIQETSKHLESITSSIEQLSRYDNANNELIQKLKMFENQIQLLTTSDPELIRIILNSREAQEFFGADNLRSGLEILTGSLHKTLLDNPNGRSASARQDERILTRIGSISSVKYLLLAAFTQPGGSGEWPLASGFGNPEILQYLKNVDQEGLKAFIEDPQNERAAALISAMLEKKTDLSQKAFEDPKFRNLIQDFFSEQLHKANEQERRFIIRRLADAHNSLDLTPFINTIPENDLKVYERRMLIEVIGKNPTEYAETIIRKRFNDWELLNSLAETLKESHRTVELPFLAEILEQLVEDPEILDRFSFEMLTTLFAHTKPTQESFDQLANAFEEKHDRQELTHKEITANLARIALRGTPRATEMIAEGYKRGANHVLREEIVSQVIEHIVDPNKKYDPNFYNFLIRHFELVQDGEIEQKIAASALIQDLITNRTLSEKNPELQTAMNSYLENYKSELASSDNATLQLHSLSEQLRQSEISIDSLQKYLGILETNDQLLEKVSDYEIVTPYTLVSKYGLHNLPANEANRLVRLLSIPGGTFVIYASILHLQGNLDEENTAVLQQHGIRLDPKEIHTAIAGQSELNERNWLGMLAAFINTDGEDNVELEPEEIALLKEQLSDPEKMDICLDKLRDVYRDHLAKKLDSSRNIDAEYLAKVVKKNDGAGHLRHIGAIAEITDALTSLDGEHTKDFTKREVLQSLQELEEFFDKNRWGNEDRSFFYNAAAKIIKSAPSLFSEVCHDLKTLEPKQGREFVREIFPTIQAQLILSEKKLRWQEATPEPRKIVNIRRSLIHYREKLEAGHDYKESTDHLRDTFIERVKTDFKERFSIKKVPEEFSPDVLRALQDFIIYSGNISTRDSSTKNQALISLYLSLTINGLWEDFRSNKLQVTGNEANFDLKQYLDENSENYRFALDYMTERNGTNFLRPDILGLSEEEMKEFSSLLQEEETAQYLGNIQTVDNKLEGVLRQLEAFSDPDTFPEQARGLLPVLREHSPRAVNSALGKRIQIEMGKSIPTSDEDQEIISKLLANRNDDKPMQERLIEIQSDIKIMAQTESILQKKSEYIAEITKLRDLLKPDEQIIEIFKKLGEDFSQESGAMAISQDLTYLEAILNKNQDQLNDPADQALVKQYIEGIREQMQVLEKAISDIDNKLASVSKLAEEQHQVGIQNITAEIIANVRKRETEMKIISVCTNKWAQIIENMRQCLACNTDGVNNDTNLTFGDPNKFYLYSQAGEKHIDEGSIADQIVFFSPVMTGKGTSMAFVFDRVYGNNSPDILIGHIIAVAKKYNKIKSKFKNANLSMFVTAAALKSAGLNEDMLASRLPADLNLKMNSESGNTDIVSSPAGDHYIEFGSQPARDAGVREALGVELFAA